MPLMNPNALRVPEAEKSWDRERCGYAAEVASTSFIGISTALSGMVTYYLVFLYTVRVRYQVNPQKSYPIINDSLSY